MPRRKPKIKTEDDVIVMDVDMDGDDHAIIGDEIASSSAVFRQAQTRNNDGGDMDADDADEIVREIPVFLSPDLSSQIQLVQFPLQQNKHPMGPDTVRIKPRHCMMEMDVRTPSNIEFNGLYSMPARTFKSQTIPVSTHMALGKMIEVESDNDDGNGNKPRAMGLHLVPLSRMTQMRPSFSHIDRAAEASSATTEEDLKMQESQKTAGAERKSITFRKKESERQELARKSSYGYKKASEDAEGWHNLKVYDEASLHATLIMGKVACPVEHQNRNLLDVDTLEKEHNDNSTNKKIPGTSLNTTYLNTLDYLPPRNDFGSIQSMGNLGNSNISALNASGNDENARLTIVVTRLVQLMRQGMPIPFSLLRAEFPVPSTKGGGISDKTLCVALGSCAVLVRGNWCINSKYLPYPKAMAQARTFLLCLFQSMRTVHRERLINVFVKTDGSESLSKQMSMHPDGNTNNGEDRVTPEVIELLLDQLGEKTSEGWILKVADDTKFAEEHPETTLVHLQHWAKQIELFRPLIERYRADI